MQRRPTPAEKRFKAVLLSTCLTWQVHLENQRVFWNNELNRGYIVDFYVPRFRVAFEIDGTTHQNEKQIGKDKIRDEWLTKHHIKVVRIQNKQTKDYDWCKNKILETLYNRKFRQNLKLIRKAKKQVAKPIGEYWEGNIKITVLPEIKATSKIRRNHAKKKERTCKYEPPGTVTGSVIW